MVPRGEASGRAVRADASGNRTAHSLLLAVFFASGFAALLYQVVWQRILALFSGADVFSVTIVVSAFMAGLGVGNFTGGHVADRLSRARCLALFAAAEVAIALFAFASKALYYDLLYVRLGGLALPAPALAAVLFAAVVWPTFFMGVSLPLLARGLTTGLEAAAGTVGSLYGWNTLGAALGAFATTWLLVRRFDLETCLQIGGAVNLACAAAVLLLRRWIRPDAEEPSRSASSAASAAELPPPARPPGFGLPVWLLLYGLSGTVALSLEIAWFRALGVMLKSTSFTFGSLLGIYLLGVGSGSVVGARLVARSKAPPILRFLGLQASIAALAVLSLAILVASVAPEGLRMLWRYFQLGEPLPVGLALAELGRNPLGLWTSPSPAAAAARVFVGLYFLLPFLLVGPATFLMGLSFPYLQRAVQTEARLLGRRVGWLQTANITGSLIGSLATGFVLLPAVGTPGTFRILTALGGVFLLLWARVGITRGRGAWGIVAAIWLLSLLVLPGSTPFWARLHGALPGNIIQTEDASGVSLVRFLRRPAGERVVAVGGLELSRIPFGHYEGIHTLLGALPVLLHPAPRRVAVIGLGSGDTSYAAGANPASDEVVTIEIVSSQFDVLRAMQRRQPYPGLERLFTLPRFRFVVGDGRTWLRRDPARYDVIEADALRPTSAYAGNLYSVEYFALLRERLAPGGLAVSWLPTTRTRDTLIFSFPHVLMFGDIGIGSSSPIPYDRDALLARCQEPAIREHFASIGLDLGGIVRMRLAAATPSVIGPDVDRTSLRDLNSDLFPKDEFLIGRRSR